MRKSKITFLFQFAVLLLTLVSCSKDNDQIEYVYVDIYCPLDLPSYSELAIGNPMPITGGVKGIIINQFTNVDFKAFERNCPYEPQKQFAVIINVDKISASCPDCKSRFSLYDGSVIQGPAQMPLKQYLTSFDNTNRILHIFN